MTTAPQLVTDSPALAASGQALARGAADFGDSAAALQRALEQARAHAGYADLETALGEYSAAARRVHEELAGTLADLGSGLSGAGTAYTETDATLKFLA